MTRWLFLLPFLAFIACSPQQKLHRSFDQTFANPAAFNNSFTGFILLDPATGETLEEFQSDKYFTPASNTKLFTFYTCIRLLPEKWPLLQYQYQGDSLIFWGTGHPGFLHPAFPPEEKAIELLSKHSGEVYYADGFLPIDRFGPGWAWDDYLYGYQAERTPLPIYGNLANIRLDTSSGKLQMNPPTFRTEIQINGPRRAESKNTFGWNPTWVKDSTFNRWIPILFSDRTFEKLLSDTLDRPVYSLPEYWLPTDPYISLDSEINPDSIYRKMLRESDNFLAEQLLMLCSFVRTETLNPASTIEFMEDSLLADLPDPIRWVDGSGLSRYNLFTPRSIAHLLWKMYQEIPEDRLLGLLPAGGRSGTIKDWYGAEEPYVFAKTGTLSNKHCLSGYIRTKSGKILIFSFMHNNYLGSSAPLKETMERLLLKIQETY